MKRLLTLILTGLMSLSLLPFLVGCGDKAVEQPEASTINEPAPTPAEPIENSETPEVPDAGVGTVVSNPDNPYPGLIIRFEGVGDVGHWPHLPDKAIINSSLLPSYMHKEADESRYVGYEGATVIVEPAGTSELVYEFNNCQAYKQLGLVSEYIPLSGTKVYFEKDGLVVDYIVSYFAAIHWSFSLNRAVTNVELEADQKISVKELIEIYPETAPLLEK